MPSIDIVVAANPIYISYVPAQPSTIEVKFGAVDSVNGKTGTVILTDNDLRRVTTITSSTTPTPNCDTTDQYNITALAGNATFGAPTGTPHDGQKLRIRVTADTSDRIAAFDDVFRFTNDQTIPTITAEATVYFDFIYNSVDEVWDCLRVSNYYGLITYDTDAQIYFDESTESLSSTFKSAISWGFTDLKETGNFDKIDFIFWAGGPNQTLARTNFVNPSHKLIEQVSSGWLADNYWAGDGSRYLDLQYNPSAGTGNYQRNNSGFTVFAMQNGVYEQTALLAATGASFLDQIVLFNDLNKTFVGLNSDQGQVTISKSGTLSTVTRVDGSTVNAYRNGQANGSLALPSSAIADLNWEALGWDNMGTPTAFSTNKILCVAAHSGDIDVPALRDTIYGIIQRLNGGFAMTELNINIAGMNPMDSCMLKNLSPTLLIVVGGYDPTQPSQASDQVWTSPDGVTWTQRASMPFPAAHCLGGMRSDGYLWVYAAKQTGEMFCMKMDPADYSWTIINDHLNGIGQSLEDVGGLEWGFVVNDTMYWGCQVAGDPSQVKVYSSTDGNTWAFVSNYPVGYNQNSAWFVSGSTVYVAGGCLMTGDFHSNFNRTIYKSTDGCQTWTLVRNLPSIFDSAWCNFFILNGKECFIVGSTGEETYDGYLFVFDGTNWVQSLLPELTGRHAVATVQRNNEQFFVNGLLYNDCYKLTF